MPGTPTPTHIDTITPTFTPTETATVTSTETPTPPETSWKETVLSDAEKQELGIFGDANRIEVSYEGIPVSVILIVSPSAVKNYFDGHGLTLDPSVEAIGVDPGINLAEFILLGHYRGYLEDHGLTYNTYSFEKYIQDLGSGKNRTYSIWGVDKNTDTAKSITIDPTKEVQTVFAGFTADPNGDPTIYLSPNTRIGYYLEKNGSMRTTQFFSRGDQMTLDYIANSCTGLTFTFWILGVSETEQKRDRSPVIMNGWDALSDEMDSLINPIRNDYVYPIIKER
jgi:hypothetical protein